MRKRASGLITALSVSPRTILLPWDIPEKPKSGKNKGVSAHGSAPEKGVNAVYKMAEIITRVEKLNQKLMTKSPRGTIVLSDISCVSASLNAVPSECSIYLDRRINLGDTLDNVRREMDELVEGTGAEWEVGTLRHTTWKGKELIYEPMHAPWKIEENHPLKLAFDTAYQNVFGSPRALRFLGFRD